ncbi:hypothetical protein CABS01_17120 [Colletotrichum abscissum]|uniref:uncharacterized protein n=1 Tax=Colletotrichum abscissum TaxID=1671311 RepID=UPI0027D6DCD5|nr:uncharacterized protein CABS01_17120 [Colletotrichum abscissum]KAK1491506.1 hypothetical protein CABS01_17120 [Colletotrichum abscissum]
MSVLKAGLKSSLQFRVPPIGGRTSSSSFQSHYSSGAEVESWIGLEQNLVITQENSSAYIRHGELGHR